MLFIEKSNVKRRRLFIFFTRIAPLVTLSYMIPPTLLLRLLPTSANAGGSLPSRGQPHQPSPARGRRQRRRGHWRAATLGFIGALLSVAESASAQQFSFSTVALNSDSATVH